MRQLAQYWKTGFQRSPILGMTRIFEHPFFLVRCHEIGQLLSGPSRSARVVIKCNNNALSCSFNRSNNSYKYFAWSIDLSRDSISSSSVPHSKISASSTSLTTLGMTVPRSILETASLPIFNFSATSSWVNPFSVRFFAIALPIALAIAFLYFFASKPPFMLNGWVSIYWYEVLIELKFISLSWIS